MKRFLFICLGCIVPLTAFAGLDISSPIYGFDCTGFVYCNSASNVVTGISFKLIGWIQAFIVALAVVAFFYGALRMAVSRGDEGKETGKKALMYASIGLVAAILTSEIINFIRYYIYLIGA